MVYKTICCISSNGNYSHAEKLCLDIKKYLGVSITMANSADFPVQDYDVVLYVHSKESLSDTTVCNLLIQAYNLNKTFLPVIIGGTYFHNLILKFKYNGPNLRTSFLSIKNRNKLFELYNRIASLSGVKLVGDPIGAKFICRTDYDCKLIRSNTVIAELKANVATTINLYYGSHKIIALSKADKKIKKDFFISVDNIDQYIVNFCSNV